MALTDRGISNLKPQLKHVFLADSGGLYLRVHPTGTKTFLYRSRSQGNARWVTLGEYPHMSLADARRKALELKVGRLPHKITASTAYADWYAHITKSYRSPLQVQQRLGKHFLPAFGDRVLAQLTRAELSSHLVTIAVTAPVQANRVLTDLKQFFSYAVARGWIDDSPVTLLTQKAVGGKETTRDRVLSDEEIIQLIGRLCKKNLKMAGTTRAAIAILLLTGVRSNEARGLSSQEVGTEFWSIPEDRTKNGDPHNVAVGKTLTWLFKSVFKEYGSSPFGCMEGQVLSRAVSRMGFEVRWTPHDLRRTMATNMAGMGVAPHVIEKCLNHRMPGVMGIYNREEYAAEKKAAWRLWERKLLRLAKKRPRG